MKIQNVLNFEDRWKMRGYGVQAFHYTKNSLRLYSKLRGEPGPEPMSARVPCHMFPEPSPGSPFSHSSILQKIESRTSSVPGTEGT